MKKMSGTTKRPLDETVAESEQVTHLNPHNPTVQLAYLVETASTILSDPSHDVKTPRKRKPSYKVLAASGELDREQDDAPNEAMAQEGRPAASSMVQTQQALTLNLQDPFDKNLLDSCLAYTGRPYTQTAKYEFTLTQNRVDGSLAYKHVLVIPPSEDVGHTSLGELKMFPKLDAHFALHAWHKRYVFEMIARQSPHSTKVDYQWQCVNPNATVPPEELAMLPQGCAVGTLVITKRTAKRMATEILEAGGDVPAYIAAHDLKTPPATQAIKPTLTHSSTATTQTQPVGGDVDATHVATIATIASTAKPPTTLITLPQRVFSRVTTISAEKPNTSAVSANATTMPAANTFGRVMQSLSLAPVTKAANASPVAAISNDLLTQLSEFAEDELTDDTRKLRDQAQALAGQIEQEKQKIAQIAQTAKVALQAYIAQQQKALVAAQETQARLRVSLNLPPKEGSTPKPND